MKRSTELEAPVLLVLVLLTILWIALVWKGLDPMRLLRSQFKSPRHYLTPGSYAERERLVAPPPVPPPGVRTGQTLLYADCVAHLDDCQSAAEVTEVLTFIHHQRLVNSDIKAQHFAQHCRRQRFRPEDLPVAALSAVIASLHRYARFPVVAECIAACFTSARGPRCLELKTAVEEHICTYRLVYHHLRSSSIRASLLAHFAREAAVLTASSAFVRPIKLLCDIDDTMISVLFDTRYPELTVYPGVHQFVEEILTSGRPSAFRDGNKDNDKEDADAVDIGDGGVDNDDSKAPAPRRPGPRMAFLTARPSLLRRRSIRELRTCGFFHFSLLMGRLSTSVLGPRRIAAGKLENFENFRRVFPEHQFVFVGDNGQGDIDLGKDLLRDPVRFGTTAVLIHDVIRNHRRADEPEDELLEPYRGHECREHGLHIFRTYISATSHLYRVGLVGIDSVRRVMHKTAVAYASIHFESQRQRASLAKEIAADVLEVLRTIPEVAKDQDVVATMPSDVQELLVLTPVLENGDCLV